jgi:RNA polymerase sigma-70 factor (ECF subfamily)
LYQQYLPLVWRYAYAQCRRNVHLAEDVVSDTLLALVKALPTLDPEKGSFGAWLTQVLRHKIADHRRRRSVEWTQVTPLADWNAVADQREREGPVALETGEVVAAVMLRLDDEERLVLEWKYIEGLSVRQMGQRLGRTEKAIESLLFRARRSFQACLARLENPGGF